MKRIEISQNELQLVLNNGGMFTGKSKTLPIYDCVKITTHENRIKVESMDGERYIRYYGTCVCNEDLSFCVGGQDLISYVNAITSEMVYIDLDEENNCANISHTHGNLTLSLQDVTQFPTPKVSDEKQTTTINGETFSLWLKQGATCADKNDISSPLGGVNIFNSNGNTGVMSSDRARVYQVMVHSDGSGSDFSATIPIATANILSRICENNENIKLVKTDTHLVASTNDYVFICSIIGAKFPNVAMVLERKVDIVNCVDRNALLNALKRLSSQVSKDSRLMRIESTGTELRMNYIDTTQNREAKETVPCDGGAFEITGVNINNFQNTIGMLTGDNVFIGHNNSCQEPFLFKEETDRGALTLMVAPMRMM